MNKKIGIITFHRADNLGAVLQAYALQTVLQNSFGIDVEILDYRCPRIEGDQKKASGLKGLALKCYYHVKHCGFEKFRRKYLRMSPSCTAKDVACCAGEYDTFITGSDQVWNYECSDWDDAYFLNFVPPHKKKYAYAASLGRYCFTLEEQSHVQQLLKDYSGISLREKSAVEQIAPLYSGELCVCADPVVLLTKVQWMEIMPGRMYPGRYVFVYLIMDSENVLRHANAYAAKQGCKVICNKTSPEFILRGSPSDFLSWIYHAQCVFTNSFHGTAFSLVFEKPLAADIWYPDGKTNKRVHEMLLRAGAEACALGNEVEQVHTPNAGNMLKEMRESAFGYLERICTE